VRKSEAVQGKAQLCAHSRPGGSALERADAQLEAASLIVRPLTVNRQVGEICANLWN
jgi:hypothetical protein